MAEKKIAQLACKTTEDIKKRLLGLAAMNELTLSEYQERIFIEHLEKKRTEAILLNEALGIN